MEQVIAVFGVNWKLLLVQVVNFGLLLIVLHKFLYRPILKMIEGRRTFINEGVTNALKAREELGKIDGEREKSRQEALIAGEKILKDSRIKAEAQGQTILSEVALKESRILRDAEQKAKDEKARILKEAEAELAKIAVLGAEKILREKNI